MTQEIVCGDLRLTLAARHSCADFRRGILFWSRPNAVVVTGPDGTWRLPIVDVTRRVQAVILLAPLLVAFGLLSRQHQRKEGSR